MMRLFIIALLSLGLWSENAMAASKGTLVIRCPEKGADVLVNGLSAGKTPLRAMNLRPGSYKIEVSRLGFMTYRKTIQVQAGETSLLKAPLRAVAGVVQLSSNVPGAQVLVKGENVGTVDAPIEIGIGRVELQIIAPGYEVLSLTVDGLPGQWLKRKVTLVAASGSLELDTLTLDMPMEEPAELSLDLELDMPASESAAPELALDLEPELEPAPAPKQDIAAQAMAPMPKVDGAVAESGQWYTNPWIWTGTGAVIVSAVVTGILMTQRPEASPYDAVIQLD